MTEEEPDDYELLQNISSLKRQSFSVPAPKNPENPKKKANSERQLWVQETADMLSVPFKVVLYKTMNWPTDWIRDFYFYCKKNGDPPAKLWWGLIKKR